MEKGRRKTNKMRLRKFLIGNRYLVTYVVVSINAGWLALVLFNHTLAFELTLEDGAIEWLQFFFLIAAVIYSFRIFRLHRLAYHESLIAAGFITFSFLAFILACEEISWGQRILQVETPEFIGNVNAQNEISLHNHQSLQRFRHWLLIVFGGVGILLIWMSKYKSNFGVVLSFMAPPKYFNTAFFLIMLSGIFVEFGYLAMSISTMELARLARHGAGRFSEIGELGVSMVAFCYAYDRHGVLLLKDY